MNKYLLRIIGGSINLISYISSKQAAKLAIKLFSTPLKGKILEHEQQFLETAKQEKINYKDISIMTYNWSGYKETILLAHGWESNTFRWKDLIEILQTFNYNIVSLDAPAHGKSTGKEFNALVYSECINLVAKKFSPDAIIGHSVGGMATIFCQYKYQLQSIKKLIILGAPADFKGVFKRYTKMMGYNKKTASAMALFVLKHYNHLPDYFSAANFTNQITTKGLIIHDKKDRIIPYSDALKYEKHYVNSTLITTKGFGHGLKTNDVYNYILKFLNP